MDIPFERSSVTDDAIHSLVKPISRNLTLRPHPLCPRNPPSSNTCNVQDASQAACGLYLDDRHRVRLHSRQSVQLAADGDNLLAGEKVHQIQEVNPESVTVARGYYSLPGVPTLTLTTRQLAGGEWELRRQLP